MSERRIPTTKHRRGRVTARQAAALTSPSLIRPCPAEIDPADLFGPSADDRPLVLDIGFGTGAPVAAAALADPHTLVLAVDSHTPGIGDLLAHVEEQRLQNVRVVDGDARDVLSALPLACLSGVRTYFPDPWPKTRHHRRRLVQADTASLVASRVRPGGWWHLATDWPDYAEHITDTLGAMPEWVGGVISRPASRPVTRYEQLGVRAGRAAIDLWFERVDP